VLIGPAVGEDAFAVGVGQTAVAASTDPITFAGEHMGYYAVHVNASDVATMGAEPKWFMATVLVPPGTPAAVFRKILDEIDEACVNLGARLCGGHTEVTSGVSRPVVIGAMIGTVGKRRLVDPRRARPGDRLLLTRGLAIEGTSIIARTRRREVASAIGPRRAARARRMLFDPGISVVREALSASSSARVHAMHDPTEGGLLWGLAELSGITGKGFVVDLDSVPVYPLTDAVCRHFGLNPLALIASGSLLIAAAPRNAARISREIRALGVECTDIGKLAGRRRVFLRKGKPIRVRSPMADEITRVL
jgi:hydrogenase maturation factor